MDDHLLRVVAKADVLKADPALHRGQGGGTLGVGLLLQVQKGEDPLGRRRHGLDGAGDLGELHQGLHEGAHILDEGLDIPHGDEAHGGLGRAHHHHQQIAQVVGEVHDGLHQAGKELAFPGALVELLVLFLEAVQAALFLAKGLDHHVAGIGFLHLAGDVPDDLLLGFEIALGALENQGRHHHGQGHHQRHQQGQEGADDHHHHQYPHQGGDAGHKLGDDVGDVLVHRGDVVGDPGQHVPDAGLFVVGHGHLVDFLPDSLAQLPGEVRDHPHGDPGHEEAEEGRDQVEHQQHQEHLADAGKIDAARPPHLGHQAFKDGGGGLAGDLGAHDAHGGA